MRKDVEFDCGHTGWIELTDDPDTPGEVVKVTGGAVALDSKSAIQCRVCREASNA